MVACIYIYITFYIKLTMFAIVPEIIYQPTWYSRISLIKASVFILDRISSHFVLSAGSSI
jgi:hypothetical protein